MSVNPEQLDVITEKVMEELYMNLEKNMNLMKNIFVHAISDAAVIDNRYRRACT